MCLAHLSCRNSYFTWQTETFTIKAEGLSEANKYVKSITLNGEPYTKNFISHADIVKGGTLVYQMTDKK